MGDEVSPDPPTAGSEIAEAPAPEQTREAPADDQATGGPSGLRIVSLVRVVVGVFGFAGLVLGALVAWNSESATTLLIVSAVLLLLAALGLDWNKIRGTYGGLTLELLRDIGDRIDQATVTAASEEVSAELRAELEALRTEIKALTPAAAPARRRPRSEASSPERIQRLVRELMTTKASHSFRGVDAVELSLRIALLHDPPHRCTVTTPHGHAYSAIAHAGFATSFGPRTYTVVYPDHFDGSEPLSPGRYAVEWRRAPADAAGTNPLLASLAQSAAPPVATDSFTIPDLIAEGQESTEGSPS